MPTATTETNLLDQYRLDRKRWLMLGIFCLLISSSIGAFGCIGSLVDVAQKYYGLEDIVFNVVFYGSYVDFLISAPIWHVLLQRIDLKGCMITAACLSITGYTMQLFYQYSFWFVPFGGMLCDTCRCLCWIAGNMFISRWFSVGNKAATYGSLFVSSSVVSIVLVAVIRVTITNGSEYHDRFFYFPGAFLLMTVLALILTLALFEDRPKIPPGPQTDTGKLSDSGHLIYTEWRRTNYFHVIMFISVYVCSTMGNWSISMVLLQFMNNKNYSNQDITIAAISYALCSLPTPLITGYAMDRTKAYREVAFAVLLSTTCVFLAWIFSVDHREFFFVTTSLLAFVTGSFSATMSECVAELAFPVHESYVSTTMFTFAQVSSPVGTVLCSFSDTIWPAIWLFFAIYLASTLVVAVSLHYPVVYKRITERPVQFNLTNPEIPSTKQS